MRRSRGFTLIEVLVALMITALLGVMAYAGISGAIAQKTASQKAAERLNEVTFFFALLSKDLMQVAARSVRDEYEEREAALVGGEGWPYIISFTRGGWSNPLMRQRSELQRISYQLEDGSIERAIWADLDRSSGSVPLSDTVLSEVDDVQIRFLQVGDGARDDGLGGQWVTQWGVLVPPDQLELMPRAIEMTVQLRDWGEVTRLFEIATDDLVPIEEGAP